MLTQKTSNQGLVNTLLPGMPGNGPGPSAAVLALGITDIEVRAGERKVPVGRGAKITGYHPIRHGHGAVAYESTLERDFLSLLAQLPVLIKVVSQPVTVHFSVWGDRRRYTPDFLVSLSHIPSGLADLGLMGCQFFAEIKHSRLLDECTERLECALTALRMITGLPALVLTEQQVRVRGEECFHG